MAWVQKVLARVKKSGVDRSFLVGGLRGVGL